MDDDTTQRQRPAGRTLNKTVVGDTADEIEMAALDAAREFFGPDVQLEIAHDYIVTGNGPGSPHTASGKRYCAGVNIRTVEP